MIYRQPISTVATIALVAILLTACNRVERMPTVLTKGVVRLDNKPVPAAQVTFTPARGRSASAQTTADGTFVLTTYETGDGATVGRHQVTVTAREAGEGNSAGAPGITRPGKSLIPERYGDTATSGLSYEVADGKENNFEISLLSR